MQQTVLVTGGAQGIGESIVRHIAEQGHRIAIVDWNIPLAQSLSLQLNALGHDTRAYFMDVADIHNQDTILAQITEDLGVPLVLVNNAAIGGGELLADVTPERFDSVFGVSVRGSFFLTQKMVPAMKAARWGRILNISSLIAARGENGNPHYVGAKAAQMGFTRSWARELAPFGITVNTILPALTETPMAREAWGADFLSARAASVPAGRLASVDDCATIAAFLISDQANFLTGQALSANGGEFVGAL